MTEKNLGFTLIELLVVIAIIGLLSTLAAAGVNLARKKAMVTKAQSDVDQIFKAITLLANDALEWPGHQQYNTVCTDLGALCPADNEICGPDDSAVPNTCAHSLNDGVSGIVTNDTAAPFPSWSGPYMPRIPEDPWDNQYFFDTDYMVDEYGKPWGCADGTVSSNVVAVGSYGPNGIGPLDGAGANDCDDVIKIIK